MSGAALMIGDWVKYNVPNGATFRIGPLDLYDAKDYKPIRITHEILERNGFEYEENEDETLICWVGDSLIELDEKTRHFLIANWERCYEGEIDYVHELQHILRICKIDKEIEL